MPPKIPEPPGAYGPTQYPIIGMNCSFCATAAVAMPASARPSRAALRCFMIPPRKRRLSSCSQTSIGLARPGVVSMTGIKVTVGSGTRFRWADCCTATSMRERPQPQLFLADLPEPGEAMRLDDQEEDDQCTKYNQFQVGHEPGRQRESEQILDRPGHRVEEDRQQRDEG